MSCAMAAFIQGGAFSHSSARIQVFKQLSCVVFDSASFSCPKSIKVRSPNAHQCQLVLIVPTNWIPSSQIPKCTPITLERAAQMIAISRFRESQWVFFFESGSINDRILQILDHQHRESIARVLRVALLVPSTAAYLLAS